MSILRLTLNKFELFRDNIRTIATTASRCLKEIHEEEDGKNVIIQGVHLKSPREPYLLKLEDHSKCPICALGLDVKHTDVLILSQFLRQDGCMLPRRITGLCNRQQRKVSTLVTMAQKAGLMPNMTPSYSHKDPKKRNGYKKYNKYFDESTIKERKPKITN